jgi:hypothetical protein
MNITYETLMNSDLDRLEELIEFYNKKSEEINRNMKK